MLWLLLGLLTALLIGGVFLARRRNISFANFVTILASLATFYAVPIGVYTFYEGAGLQREVAAIGLYREYLQQALEHPELAEAQYSSDNAAEYSWFVAQALSAGEQILISTQGNKQWESTIRRMVQIHKAYICSETFPRTDYEPIIMDLAECN